MKKGIMLALFLVFFVQTVVFAHQMVIEPLPQQRIKVYYEGGTSSKDINITLFDATGQVVFMKKVDEKGEFDYSRYSKVDSLIADDGMGHRVMWKVGEPVHNVTGNERWIRISLIASTLAAIGYAFYERSKRKRLETILNNQQMRGGI